MKTNYSLSEVADMLSVSKETLRRWDKNGKLTAVREPMSNYRVCRNAAPKHWLGSAVLTTRNPAFEKPAIERSGGAIV